jgi:hypothetical protein
MSQMHTQIEMLKMKGEYDVKIAEMKGQHNVLETILEERKPNPQIVHVGYPGNPFYGPFFPVDSVLLQPSHHNILQSWIGRSVQWITRYRGSRDGSSSSSFHARCDHVGPTITIVRSSNGYLFGGYNPNSWSCSQGYQSGGGSFLFTLTNPNSQSPTALYNVKSGNGPYDNSGYGPTWGGGHDLHIGNGWSGSYSNLSHSYNDPTGSGNNLFTGSRNFGVSEIEVFSV